ncbi:hypothetical protein LCGC14_1262880 [marine sediment metagenome]|uniref:Uncharacterized protein n=1 Tax=marine sediment metagenome TaxID=412755 RepID=A0A0F9NGZ1_9ZZZZ
MNSFCTIEQQLMDLLHERDCEISKLKAELKAAQEVINLLKEKVR